MAEKMKKTDEEWKDKLSEEQYQILRQGGTEAPFSGKYWNEHSKGMYVCSACGLQLFASDVKFDSGTGWPSFSDALPGAVEYYKDENHGMSRTEVRCARCGSHLGHVFDDGPKEKGGKRYCINSVCLDLKQEDATG